MKNWNAIVNMMDDEIREQVHMELAPCTDEEFLKRYLELDPEFERVLNEFSQGGEKMMYTREMLNHDYQEEASNYVSSGMTDNEIAADLKQCLSEYELEDEHIYQDYLNNLLKAVEEEREGRDDD